MEVELHHNPVVRDLLKVGTLVKEDGGFRFNAKKIFGSGCPAGDLLLTTGVYDDPDNGPSVLHFGVNLRGEGITIADDWDTLTTQ